MPARTPEQREKDLITISDMALRGRSLRQIAAQIGIAHSCIVAEMKLIRERWREDYTAKADEHITRELAKLERMETEAWDAWERSQAAAVTKRTRREDGLVAKTINEVTSTDQVGNSVYLQLAHDCMKSRRKLLGLDAPEKVEHSGALTVTDMIGKLSALDDAEPAQAPAPAAAAPGEGPAPTGRTGF